MMFPRDHWKILNAVLVASFYFFTAHHTKPSNKDPIMKSTGSTEGRQVLFQCNLDPLDLPSRQLLRM